MAAAPVVVALAAGAAAGVPTALVALGAARAFASAAARYRFLAVAFCAAAAQPFVAVLVSLHAAASAGAALPLERALLAHGSLAAIFAVAGAVGLVLLVDVAVALGCLLRVKRTARIDGRFAAGVRGALVSRSAAVDSPTAIGYRRPCIVLPADLDGRVDAAELRAIIAHEHAHLARYDDWAKALQAIVARALWFVPALWMLGRRLDLERELASDERVAATVEPRAYAACLLRLAVEVPGRHLAPAAWRGRAQIAIRVERLVRPERRLPAAAGALGIAGLAAALVLSVLGVGALVPAGSPPSLPVPARQAHAPARPVRATELLATEPGAPCRTCVLLRRPVADGPAIARPALVKRRPGTSPSARRDANSLSPSWAGLVY